jgi:hypothetical protein
MSEPFRTPVTNSEPAAKAPEPKDSTTSTMITEDTLIYTYEQENGHPYTAKHYGISDVYDSELFGKEVGTVEAYLKALVEDKQLDNSTEAAKKLLKKLEKQAGIDPTEPTNARIEKLAAFVRFKDEVRQHDKEKRKWQV